MSRNRLLAGFAPASKVCEDAGRQVDGIVGLDAFVCSRGRECSFSLSQGNAQVGGQTLNRGAGEFLAAHVVNEAMKVLSTTEYDVGGYN